MLTNVGADLFTAAPHGIAAPAPPRPAAAHPFAELLRQNQAADRLAGATARSIAADDVADTTGPSETPRPAQVQKAKPRQAGAPPPAPRSAEHAPDDKAAGGSVEAPDEPPPAAAASGQGDASPAGAPAAPDAARTALLDLLARALDASADADADAGSEEGAALAGGAAHARGRARGAGRSGAAAGAASAESTRDAAGAADAGATRPDLQRLADPVAGPARAPGGPRHDAKTSPIELPSLGSALAAASPAPMGPHAAPAVDVRLATPPGEPGFAQALGVQVSILARDGIQRAELHLHPQDMGPVSILIVVDGTQARVDFGADVAATRQAIESGLPELASALQACGLTLHGGGVSQHSPGRRQAEATAADDPAARDADAEVEAGALPTRRLGLHAGVDLYA